MSPNTLETAGPVHNLLRRPGCGSGRRRTAAGCAGRSVGRGHEAPRVLDSDCSRRARLHAVRAGSSPRSLGGSEVGRKPRRCERRTPRTAARWRYPRILDPVALGANSWPVANRLPEWLENRRLRSPPMWGFRLADVLVSTEPGGEEVLGHLTPARRRPRRQDLRKDLIRRTHPSRCPEVCSNRTPRATSEYLDRRTTQPRRPLHRVRRCAQKTTTHRRRLRVPRASDRPATFARDDRWTRRPMDMKNPLRCVRLRTCRWRGQYIGCAGSRVVGRVGASRGVAHPDRDEAL